MTDQDPRTKPCPCGSGRAFGDCCASPTDGTSDAQAQPVIQQVKQNLEGQAFDSDADMRQALAQEVEAHNHRPQDDFQGLTPEQMHRLVYYPFDAPDMVRFGAGIQERPAALILDLFMVIAEQAYDQPGIKLTDRGNVPRSVVNQAKTLIDPAKMSEERGVGVIRNEKDWEPLHVTRLVVGMAGLTRKNKGRLLLTKRARSLLDKGQWGELFRILLETYCRQFNWPYSDGHAELPFIQQGVGFSLYLLHRFGDQWRSPRFYADAFLQAFPDLPAEVPEETVSSLINSPEEKVRQAWELRTLSRFGHWFGLVQWREDPEAPRGPMGMGQGLAVQKTDLFEQAVQWGIE